MVLLGFHEILAADCGAVLYRTGQTGDNLIGFLDLHALLEAHGLERLLLIAICDLSIVLLG